MLLASTASVALAANVSGDGTLVGSTGSDNIAAGNGNDTVWGLGGNDTISAGNGNDVVDAGGQCAPGTKPGDYPNGLPSTDYCEHVQIPNSNATISVGNGNDTVYGDGGTNTISAGCGDDVIYGGPIADTIAAGASTRCQADDQIYLGSGPQYRGSNVATGSGNDVIHAQNGVKDTISCTKGNGTKVYADRTDSVKGCASVIYTPDPNPGPNPRPTRDRTRAHTRAHHTRHHRRAHKGRRAHRG